MKYNTKEIKVKEIINLIGNLEADGYRGEDWNPSNVFDIFSENVVNDMEERFDGSIYVSVVYGSTKTRAICVYIGDVIRVFGNIAPKDKVYIQHYFNQSYKPDDSSEINLEVIRSWMNETICRLRSLQ